MSPCCEKLAVSSAASCPASLRVAVRAFFWVSFIRDLGSFFYIIHNRGMTSLPKGGIIPASNLVERKFEILKRIYEEIKSSRSVATWIICNFFFEQNYTMV